MGEDLTRAPVLARSVVVTSCLVFCTVAFIHVAQAGAPVLDRVLAAAYLMCVLGAQVVFLRPQTRPPIAVALLLAQAVLVFVPMTHFGQAWAGMPILLAANAVIVLPPRIGWPVCAGTVVLTCLAQWFVSGTWSHLGEVVLAAVAGTLEFYGMVRLARSISTVHAARAELAEVAVAGERARFSRDLRELLGRSLAGIGPKASAALQGRDPDRVGAQLGAIADRARGALAAVRLAAGGYRESVVPSGPRTRVSWLVPAVLTGIVATAVVQNASAGVTVLLVTAGFALASLAVQLVCVRVGGRPAVLLAQAVLAYLPVAVLGAHWPGVVAFVGGSALVLLPPVAGWSVFCAAVASVPAIQAAHGVAAMAIVNGTATAVITGLVVYGLTWLTRVDRELRAVRFELARAAVAEERLRFARDLHDLLGLSLSAIALKAELARRLVEHDGARARREIGEIADLARTALADVRLVAGGYCELSFAGEVCSARSVLAAAEVEARFDLPRAELPHPVQAVLATVLREGVTNVLRHGKRASTCEISVRQRSGAVELEIVNAARERTVSGGSGLTNLSARVTAVGGTLTAGPLGDGRFRLAARVPLQPARLAGDADGVDPVAGVELADDRRQVVPHRARRQVEARGDVHRVEPGRGQLQDLDLPAGQRAVRAVPRGEGEVAVDDPAARRDAADGVGQLVRGGVLEQKAADPRGQRPA
ncbi:Sensor histidine kinase DesK [Actinokineospora sp. UTMC 2448]|nr:Sensor histidine kinase DesK [Actinokineospora sp. UTMC 2448]